MKRFLALIMAVMMCLCLISCGQEEGVPEGMKLASNKKMVTYSLFVPEAWIVDLSDARTAAHVSDADRTSVNVAQWNYTGKIEDWWKDEYKVQNFETNAFSNVTILSVNEDKTEGKDIVLDGKPAKQYEYTAKLGDSFFKYQVIACVCQGSIHVIHFTYMQDLQVEGAEVTYSAYERHAETVKSIIDNFKF